MAATFTFTRRELAGGGSAPPYELGNLGDHVGDAPVVVEDNRRALAVSLGADRSQLVFMQQVHGAEVTVVDQPCTGPVPAVDGLVTAVRGIALAVLVADCVPVLLADDDAGVIAAVHAGRRGVAADIVTTAIGVMRSLGARSIRAALGPHIGPCCYEVGSDVQDEVAQLLPVTRSRTRAGTPALDLAAGLKVQLAAAGVNEVEVSPICTAEDAGLFSYRRDGVTGRFAGVVRLPS